MCRAKAHNRHTLWRRGILTQRRFGHASPFEFSLEYKPAPGVLRFLAGTPPILSTACIEPGLDLLLEAGIANASAKSILLSGFRIAESAEQLTAHGVTIATPAPGD